MRWNPQRLDRLEGLAKRRREGERPSVVIIVPDSAAGHPRIDGKTCMLQSDADAYADELTRLGERQPCWVHFDAEYLDL